MQKRLTNEQSRRAKAHAICEQESAANYAACAMDTRRSDADRAYFQDAAAYHYAGARLWLGDLLGADLFA